MRRTVVTALAVAITSLGVVLGLAGATGESTPPRPAPAAMLINANEPVCCG